MIQYRPELFVNRREELKSALSDLEKSRAVAVMGMRKIGKTWFLRKIEDSIREEDEDSIVKIFWCSLYENFETLMISITRDLNSEYTRQSHPVGTKFLENIRRLKALLAYRKVMNKKKVRRESRITQSFGLSASPHPALPGGRWQYEQSHIDDYVEKTLHDIGEDFLEVLNRFSDDGQRLVLMIDEFGIFNWGRKPDLSQMGITTSFWRPIVEGFNDFQNLIVSASINLFAVSGRPLPFQKNMLGPFSQSIEGEGNPSMELIERLSEHLGIGLTEKEKRALMIVGGGFPYYSLRAVEIAGALKKKGWEVSEQAVRNEIIEELRRNDIPSLKHFYSPDEMTVLQKIAEGGIVLQNELADSYLEKNYIIEFRDGMWKFADTLLAEAFAGYASGGGGHER